MSTDNVKILFHIDSRLFLDCFTVWVDWKYPFLPRIGDYVNGWNWIESEHIDISKLDAILTDEGTESLKNFKGDTSDWLFELESGHVYDVSFIKSKKGEYQIHIYLSELKPSFLASNLPYICPVCSRAHPNANPLYLPPQTT